MPTQQSTPLDEAIVTAEVTEFVREHLDRRRLRSPNWVTQELVSRHEQLSGPDAEYALVCMYRCLYDKVLAAYRKLKFIDTLQALAQPTLPGYEHVQQAYVIQRKGESCTVRIQEMTDEEILAKAEEHQKMGLGHFAHRDELLEFLRRRQLQAVAPMKLK